jgi:hypothetical protein
MTITATQLRKRLYEVLHGIEQSGEPVEVELKSTRFVIRRAEPASRLARMKPQRDAIAGSTDDLAGFSPWDEPAWREGWDELLKKP